MTAVCILTEKSQPCLHSCKAENPAYKNNRIMAFVNAEDRYGMLEIVIFPNVYEKYSALLGAGGALLFRGTVNLKENEEPKIICDSIASARTTRIAKITLLQ